MPLTRPQRTKIFNPTRVFDPAYVLVTFRLSSSNSFPDMMGVPCVQ